MIWLIALIIGITGIADDAHALASARMIALVNTERANHGLEQLSLAHNVSSQAHSAYQGSICGIEHQTNDALRSQLRDTSGGWTIGENVAFRGTGCLSAPNMDAVEAAKWLHEQWMDSPGHRANILRPEFTHLEFGLHLEGGNWYGTQVFTGRR